MPKNNLAGGARKHVRGGRGGRGARARSSSSRGKVRAARKSASRGKARKSTSRGKARKTASRGTEPRSPDASENIKITIDRQQKAQKYKHVTMSMQLTVIQGIADSLGIPFDGVPKESLVRKINAKLVDM